MRVLSHRGYWRQAGEKNTVAAFERTLSFGFGTETDVRDRLGELVVSHDPASPQAMPWADLLKMFDGRGCPLAVNIKADGLSPLLAQSFADRNIDWFAFDMSGPETFRYAQAGLPFFTRHSDIEERPVCYAEAKGVWLDGFVSDWHDNDTVLRHLDAGKFVCIVSSELHGRSYEALWDRLSDIQDQTGRVMLCTDHPERAREYFGSD